MNLDPLQPVVSFIALMAWTVVLATSRHRHPVAWVFLAISAVYAIQRLTYLDVIGGDVARTFAFTVRVALVILAAVYALRRSSNLLGGR